MARKRGQDAKRLCKLLSKSYECTTGTPTKTSLRNEYISLRSKRFRGVLPLACVTSVSVAFYAKKPIFVVWDAREMGREQKQGGGGGGGEEETLATQAMNISDLLCIIPTR